MKYIYIITLFMALWSCSEDAVEAYSSQHYLHFTKAETSKNITRLSFTHYPGATEKKVALEVILSGDILTTPTTYQLEVDTDSTTASAAQYKLDLQQTFAPNQTKDTVYVTLLNQDLAGKEVTLYFRIVENENFKPGFKVQQAARIIFNDIDSQPVWWKEFEEVFLGPWSSEKYARLIESAGGIYDFTGYEFTDMLKVCLKFKDDIKANNWTENGKLIQIPV